MLLTIVLNQPCPKCKKKGDYGNVLVSSNTLVRGCNKCGSREDISLIELNKEIIYLDQSFFSHVFRQKEGVFVNLLNRIKSLASKQLLVCPMSGIHEIESELWRSEEKENLVEFIKNASRGHSFNDMTNIRCSQIYRSFINYDKDSDDEYVFDAFENSINEWEDYCPIRADLPNLLDIEKIRSIKQEVASKFVDLFDRWVEDRTSFKEYYLEEVQGYAKQLKELYNQSIDNFLASPADAQVLETIIDCQDTTKDIKEKMNKVDRFLQSKYFRLTPFVDIECQLFAVLHKKVKMGQFCNKEKAQRKLLGLSYDIEAVSIYAPYCNAFFVDQEIKRWLNEKEVNITDRYNLKVFSKENIDEFEQYLNGIENNLTDELESQLKLVYPFLDSQTDTKSASG